jgi:hypothetical protein
MSGGDWGGAQSVLPRLQSALCPFSVAETIVQCQFVHQDLFFINHIPVSLQKVFFYKKTSQLMIF